MVSGDNTCTFVIVITSIPHRLLNKHIPQQGLTKFGTYKHQRLYQSKTQWPYVDAALLQHIDATLF